MINLRLGDTTLIMIDGFMPNSQVQKSTFSNMVELMRKDFCSDRGKLAKTKDERFCSYLCLDNEETKKLLSKYHYKRERWLDLSKYIPTLAREYENDFKKGLENYVHNVIVIDEPVCSYKDQRLCCANWIKKTGFRFKTKREYKNYDDFVSAWIDVLAQIYGNLDIKVRGLNLT